MVHQKRKSTLVTIIHPAKRSAIPSRSPPHTSRHNFPRTAQVESLEAARGPSFSKVIAKSIHEEEREGSHTKPTFFLFLHSPKGGKSYRGGPVLARPEPVTRTHSTNLDGPRSFLSRRAL